MLINNVGSKVTVEQLLCHAHDLISQPRRWCRGAEAKMKDQVSEVLPESQYAHSFCSIGALKRARYDLNASQSIFEEATRRLAHKINPDPHAGFYEAIADYNDTRKSKKAVLEKFCKAIKQTREDYGLERQDDPAS